MTDLLRIVRKKKDWVVWYARKTRFGIEWLRNVAIDWKYGGSCGGRIHTRFPETGANGTSSADYYQLDKLFGPKGVRIQPEDVIVDVGCGKGRVLNYWLHRGYRNRIYGMELDPDFAAFSANRLRKFTNVSIIAGDALAKLPSDATLFFVFNPFKAPVFEAFKKQLELQFRNRPCRILYFHCKHADVFRDDPRWTLEELHLNTFYDAVLITKKPEAEDAGK
jgi:SAM-dependent methyltransferase